MHVQYITDEEGKKNAVLLPIEEWDEIQKSLAELKRLKNKKLFLIELAEAVEEMKAVLQGKKKTRTAEEFLNEL